MTFGQNSRDVYACDTELLRWSWQLNMGSIFSIEALRDGLLGGPLGHIANQELTIGDGKGDPNGVVIASTLGKIATGPAGITADEIIDLLHPVDPAYRTAPKVRFMFNDTATAA